MCSAQFQRPTDRGGARSVTRRATRRRRHRFHRRPSPPHPPPARPPPGAGAPAAAPRGRRCRRRRRARARRRAAARARRGRGGRGRRCRRARRRARAQRGGRHWGAGVCARNSAPARRKIVVRHTPPLEGAGRSPPPSTLPARPAIRRRPPQRVPHRPRARPRRARVPLLEFRARPRVKVGPQHVPPRGATRVAAALVRPRSRREGGRRSVGRVPAQRGQKGRLPGRRRPCRLGARGFRRPRVALCFGDRVEELDDAAEKRERGGALRRRAATPRAFASLFPLAATLPPHNSHRVAMRLIAFSRASCSGSAPRGGTGWGVCLVVGKKAGTHTKTAASFLPCQPKNPSHPLLHPLPCARASAYRAAERARRRPL